MLVEYLQSLYIKDEERKLRRTQRLRKAHERRREHTKRLEGRLRKFRGQLLREGDHVRVRLANFQSGVRQQIKMGNRKQIVIRFSPEIYVVKGVIDNVYYARYVIKGEKDIKKNHDYTILRQVFDMAREGGDDWVEDRFYKGKKIE